MKNLRRNTLRGSISLILVLVATTIISLSHVPVGAASAEGAGIGPNMSPAAATVIPLKTTLNTGGDLDPSFGTGGKVTTDFPIGGVGNRDNDAQAVAVQADGKIVVAGSVDVDGTHHDFGLARYNPDGTLDTSFGVSGFSSANFYEDGRADDKAYGIAIQPDGKIVVVGTSGVWYPNDYRFAVARFNPTGFLDTTFNPAGTNPGPGRVIIEFLFLYEETSVANSVAIQADGNIVVGGYTTQGSVTNFALARLLPNGDLDYNFDGNGLLTTDFFGGRDEARWVAIQPDGKIVAAGNAQVSGSNYDFALARYNTDGSLDSGFDGDGRVTTDFLGGGDDGANAMAIQPDGKIVAAGGVQTTGFGYDFGVARYLYDGALDTGFSGGGFLAINFVGGTAEEVALGVALQLDSKIVVAGYAPASAYNDFAVARLNSDGSLDTTFGAGGKVTTDFEGAVDVGQDVAIQENKVLAVGYAYTATGADFALARYLSGDEATPSPTAPAGSSPTPTSISPSPTPSSCPIQFTDVPPGSTFYSYVHCLACQGIINGYPCGGAGEPCNSSNDPYFRPGNEVTRGQLAKIVSNAAGFSEPHTAQSFEDVAIASTFYDFVERLASRSIINGYPCGGAGEPCGPGNLPYFRPSANVTRGQTAKIVAIADALPAPPTGQQRFEDVPEGSTFWSWIESLAGIGAINGYPCGGPGEPCGPTNRPYFRPAANVTRGQASKIVSNTFSPNCAIAAHITW